MTDERPLRAAWTTAIGSGPEAHAALDDLLARHREPHRHYHGVRHVSWVVRHVHALAREVPVDDLGAVTAAAFFHDVVYDPHRHDNEERSAAVAEHVLGELGWTEGRRRLVGVLVRATAGHEATDDSSRAVLLDADLAVLGAEPAAYKAYVTGVRAEYAHLDDETWRAGRSAVLGDLLGRHPLYSTAPGRARWGARAGANMAAELAALGGSVLLNRPDRREAPAGRASASEPPGDGVWGRSPHGVTPDLE